MALKTVTNCVGLFVFSSRDNVICIACGQTRDFTHRIDFNGTMNILVPSALDPGFKKCVKIKNNSRMNECFHAGEVPSLSDFIVFHLLVSLVQ